MTSLSCIVRDCKTQIPSPSESKSIRIQVHQSIQPLTHLPIIDINKNRDYSIYSTEAISIVLLCEDERTLELNHCARIELSPTYQCISSLRSLWIMPLLCMNSKALAMSFPHPITFFAAEVFVERPDTLSWFRKMCSIKFSLQSSMTRIGLNSPFSFRSVAPYIFTMRRWISFLKKAQLEIELWNNCLLVVPVSVAHYLYTWHP